MGCWNGTCAISNLPLVYRTPARLVFLREQRKPKGSGLVHANALWMPVSFAIRGQYNDYGALEGFDPRDFGAATFQNWLASRLVEYPGTGELREPVISRVESTRSLDIIQNLIHDAPERMRVIDSLGRTSRAIAQRYTPSLAMDPDGDLLGYCLIHEDVYQTLIQTPVEGWSGVVTQASLIEAEMAQIRTVVETALNCDHKDPAKLALMFHAMRRERYEGDDEFGHTLFNEHYLAVESALANKQPLPNPEPLCQASAEFTMLSLHMRDLRKFWSPQAGAGSQDLGIASQIALHNVTSTLLERFQNPGDDT